MSFKAISFLVQSLIAQKERPRVLKTLSPVPLFMTEAFMLWGFVLVLIFLSFEGQAAHIPNIEDVPVCERLLSALGRTFSLTPDIFSLTPDQSYRHIPTDNKELLDDVSRRMMGFGYSDALIFMKNAVRLNMIPKRSAVLELGPHLNPIGVEPELKDHPYVVWDRDTMALKSIAHYDSRRAQDRKLIRVDLNSLNDQGWNRLRQESMTTKRPIGMVIMSSILNYVDVSNLMAEMSPLLIDGAILIITNSPGTAFDPHPHGLESLGFRTAQEIRAYLTETLIRQGFKVETIASLSSSGRTNIGLTLQVQRWR